MLNHSTCHEIVQNGNSIRVDARPNLKVLEKHTHPNSVPRMVDWLSRLPTNVPSGPRFSSNNWLMVSVLPNHQSGFMVLQISPHTIRLVLVHCNQVISSFIMFDHVLSLRFLSGTNNEHLMKRQRTPPSRSALSALTIPYQQRSSRGSTCSLASIQRGIESTWTTGGQATQPMLSDGTSQWEQCLVGGWALPLWKMMEFVSWDDYSQYMEKSKPCSKPPISCDLCFHALSRTVTLFAFANWISCLREGSPVPRQVHHGSSGEDMWIRWNSSQHSIWN